jgi:hypothetical protein
MPTMKNDDQPRDDGAAVDVVDPIPQVATTWNTSTDSVRRAVARGELKLTRLGPRRVGIRRSEQRRYLDERTA